MRAEGGGLYLRGGKQGGRGVGGEYDPLPHGLIWHAEYNGGVEEVLLCRGAEKGLLVLGWRYVGVGFCE